MVGGGGLNHGAPLDWGKVFLPVRVGQLSLCSLMQLLPLGIPPRLVPAAPNKVVPKTEIQGCSPPPMWEMEDRGFQITKCYQSAVRNMSR